MKRLVRPAIGAGPLLVLAATPALASHTHVMSLGNGHVAGTAAAPTLCAAGIVND